MPANKSLAQRYSSGIYNGVESGWPASANLHLVLQPSGFSRQWTSVYESGPPTIGRPRRPCACLPGSPWCSSRPMWPQAAPRGAGGHVGPRPGSTTTDDQTTAAYESPQRVRPRLSSARAAVLERHSLRRSDGGRRQNKELPAAAHGIIGRHHLAIRPWRAAKARCPNGR